MDRQKNECVSDRESGIEIRKSATLDRPTRGSQGKKNEILLDELQAEIRPEIVKTTSIFSFLRVKDVQE